MPAEAGIQSLTWNFHMPWAWPKKEKKKKLIKGSDLYFVDKKLKRIEWISNEVLLYSIGNYIQSLGIDQDGR